MPTENDPWLSRLPDLPRETDLELSDLMDVIRELVPKGTARVWRESGVRIGHC